MRTLRLSIAAGLVVVASACSSADRIIGAPPAQPRVDDTGGFAGSGARTSPLSVTDSAQVQRSVRP